MKQIKIALIAALVAWGCIFGSFIGCVTQSPQRIAYNATDTVILTVDAAMKSFANYVVSEVKAASNPPNPTRMEALMQKENKVRQAYEQYQATALIIISGEMTMINSTNSLPANQISSALERASGPLLSLIATLMK